MPRTTTFKTMYASYVDSLAQIESLKREVYIWAMHGHYEKVAKLKEAILDYENDIMLFERQMVEHKGIGEK